MKNFLVNFLVPVIVSIVCVICGYILGSRDSEFIVKYEENGVLVVDAETCGLSAEEITQLFGNERPAQVSQAECVGLQMHFKEYYRQNADNCQKQLDDLLGVHTSDPGE